MSEQTTPEVTPEVPATPAAPEVANPAATAQPVATDKPVRPDYIPESFWDTYKGFKSEDFDALVAFKSEQDSRSASVPENKDGYKVGLPVDFKIEGLEIPAGESPIDGNDPRIGFARDYAHANGYTQSQFEGLIAFGVQLDHAENQQIQEALGEQAKALGGKAKERVLAINSWLGARLGGEVAAALAPMMMTAKQVEAFERIMSLNRTVPGNPGAGRDGNGDPTKIDGYETMTFRQRLAAIDAQKSAR